MNESIANGREHRQPPLVVVLMSTYNGERYVAEQLQSILDQLPHDGQIFVRDDGSTDRTVAVIATLGDARIRLIRGTNLGFGRSFLTLLADAPSDADLVMFSDQDDRWLPGKIDRAWRHLAALGHMPALYGSAQMLVDEQLRPLQPTRPWPRGPAFDRAIAENLVTGCTAALNRAGAALLRRAGVPPGVVFHDWWLYLVVSAFGTVVIDPEPTILYRQHGHNQIGHGAGWLGRQRQMARFLLRNDWVGILLAQTRALVDCYGDDLPPRERQLVGEWFRSGENGLVPRWRLIFGLHFSRQWVGDEFAFRLLLLARRLGLWPPTSRRVA